MINGVEKVTNIMFHLFPENLQQYFVSKPQRVKIGRMSNRHAGYSQYLPKLFGVWRDRIMKLHNKSIFSDCWNMRLVSIVSSQPLCAPWPSKKCYLSYYILKPSMNLMTYTSRSCLGRTVVDKKTKRQVYHRVARDVQQAAAIEVFLKTHIHRQEMLLYLAADLDFVEVVNVLLSNGMNPDFLGYDTIDEFSPPEPKRFVDPMVERPQTRLGFRTKHEGRSGVFSPFPLKREGKAAIRLAIECESIAMIESLIKHGADVNIRTSNQTTPLALALGVGNSMGQIIQILLRARARPNNEVA
ncbi:hypothetical protein NHQ30_007523 [Ciborinia camelliae]|nr:hypothetical protein NHQ30_007523 [Ciborinia camelliae]